MKKTILVVAIALLVLGGAVALWQRSRPSLPAQETTKVYAIGVVRTPPTLDVIWESFRAKMKELGYEEGKNVVYKVTEVGGDYATTKKNVEALLNQNLDIIYPLGNLAIQATKDIAEERRMGIPIVFGIMADPVRAKLVSSLKSSGNNITGVVSANEIVSSKRLELLREAVPSIHRVIFPWADPITSGIDGLRETAKALGVTLIEKRVADVGELDAVLAGLKFQRGDALLRATDATSATRVEAMIRLAKEAKIPLAGTGLFDVQKGALMSYGANYTKMGQQGALLIHEILARGKHPTDLPIQLPAEFDLVVNLKTAKTLGIIIPQEFLAKATKLVQ